MPLPTSAAAANREFGQRVAPLEEFMTDLESAPEWAQSAFARATFSMPLLVAILGLEEKPTAFAHGFFSGLLTDVMLPLFSGFESFAEEQIRTNPNNIQLAERFRATIQYNRRMREALRTKLSDSLVATGEAKEEFLRGLKKWQDIKPEPFSLQNANIGNSATDPFLYLAAFWRGFSELKSIKEAYFAMFCMFDKNEALSGTFETFRKRAQAIGLSYSRRWTSS